MCIRDYLKSKATKNWTLPSATSEVLCGAAFLEATI